MANFADWCCQLLAGRVFDRRPRPGPCTLHDVIERGVYPYRCHRCGKCFVCAHTQTTYQRGQLAWVCADGCIVPARFTPGVPVC